MITEVCFEALIGNEIIEKIVPIEHNFEVIPESEFNGFILPKQSIESQVIDYLDTIDKRNIMSEYGFDIIFDYYIPKNIDDEIEEFINYIEPIINVQNNRLIRGILFEAKDVLFGKGKTNETKIKELIVMIDIANKSIDGVFNAIYNLFERNNDRKEIIKIDK